MRIASGYIPSDGATLKLYVRWGDRIRISSVVHIPSAYKIRTDGFKILSGDLPAL